MAWPGAAAGPAPCAVSPTTASSDFFGCNIPLGSTRNGAGATLPHPRAMRSKSLFCSATSQPE